MGKVTSGKRPSDDRYNDCAANPYELRGGRKIMLDLDRIVGYRASMKYVEALMNDGSSHILTTSLAKLNKAHPHLVLIRRDILVVPGTVQSIRRLPSSRREITLVGGWTVEPAQRTDNWRQLRGEQELDDIRVNDIVMKVTGDYRIRGEVRSVFTKANGETRMVVEHQAEGGGSFLHIYGPANLQLVERPEVSSR